MCVSSVKVDLEMRQVHNGGSQNGKCVKGWWILTRSSSVWALASASAPGLEGSIMLTKGFSDPQKLSSSSVVRSQFAWQLRNWIISVGPKIFSSTLHNQILMPKLERIFTHKGWRPIWYTSTEAFTSNYSVNHGSVVSEISRPLFWLTCLMGEEDAKNWPRFKFVHIHVCFFANKEIFLQVQNPWLHSTLYSIVIFTIWNSPKLSLEINV